MNSTPNYGYETQISAISAIDRDMKRVEDKANANSTVLAGHSDRLTRNEKDIECLYKQKCDGYSKCETDKLLDGKVDKKDGFSLISDDCLHQICTNKDNIGLLEQYIKELQEQNAALKQELSTKADGTLRTFTSLSQLGLAEGSETIHSIVSAMPIRSRLVMRTTSANNPDAYPVLGGILEVTRGGGTWTTTVEYSKTNNAADKWHTVLPSDSSIPIWYKYTLVQG